MITKALGVGCFFSCFLFFLHLQQVLHNMNLTEKKNSSTWRSWNRNFKISKVRFCISLLFCFKCYIKCFKILFLILYHCILKIWTKNSLHLITFITRRLQIKEKEKTGGKLLTTAMYILRVCHNNKYHVNWDSTLWTVNGGVYDVKN